MKSKTRRMAVWLTTFAMLAALCGGCLVTASADAPATPQRGVDLIAASSNATVAYTEGTLDVDNDQLGNGMVGNGVTVSADTAYSGRIKGVFSQGDDMSIQFGFTGNDFADSINFTITIADVSDPSNAFSVFYKTAGAWALDDGRWTAYTTAWVLYGDEARGSQYWRPDNIYNEISGWGDSSEAAPQFVGHSGYSLTAGRIGALSLQWADDVLHVRVPTNANNNDPYNTMRDIAAFDGTETFQSAVIESNTVVTAGTWGLPKLSFPHGYTVSFASGSSTEDPDTPDVYFHSIVAGESADSDVLVDFTQDTLAEVPTFYTAWTQTVREVSYTQLFSCDEAAVTASAAGVTVGTGMVAPGTYTAKINGVFSGDSEINFTLPSTDGMDEAALSQQRHTFIIRDADGDDYFELVFKTSGGYYTQAYVLYHDWIVARINYGEHPEDSGVSKWEDPLFWYDEMGDNRAMLAPRFGLNGNYYDGYIRLIWDDDVLSVNIRNNLSAASTDDHNCEIARFDGSARPEGAGRTGTRYLSPANGGTFGLEKIAGFKDGYTIEYKANDASKYFWGETPNPVDKPITFTAINGVQLGETAYVYNGNVATRQTFDLVEEAGKYYVMQNGTVGNMTTATTYNPATGWAVTDTVTAPYVGTDIDVATPNEYTVGSATVVVEPVYTLTYDTAGATAVVPAQIFSAHYKEAVVLPAEPTRTGYQFGGWYNGQTAWTGTTAEIAALIGDTTLTAQWTAETYDITYNANGGTMPGEYATTYTVESDEIALAVPNERAGYTFDGWYDNADFNGTAVTVIAAGSTGDKAYYAKWTMETYTITYNANGGTMPGEYVTTYTVASDGITLAEPTREGYTFDGWYDNPDLDGTAVTVIASGSTGNKALYAAWTVVPDPTDPTDPTNPTDPTDPDESGETPPVDSGKKKCGGMLATTAAVPAVIALLAGGVLLMRRKGKNA